MNKVSPWLVAAAFLCAHPGVAQILGTGLIRNAPQLNGTVDGNLQQMTGKSVTLNGGAIVTGDLLIPGTPSLQINGTPDFGGVIVGAGNTAPSNYKVLLNGSVRLGHLRTRTDAIVLPVLPSVPFPSGTRNVTITTAGQSIGDFTTLRNLTLNGNVGQYQVPPGTFGDFTANGGSGFTIGVAGSSQPAVYNLQHLILNGQTNLLVVGPVVINVANGFTGNGMAGTSTNSSWLKINLPSGGLTLNGGSTLYGYVTAPNGTIIINGNAKLVGGAVCNGLTVNGNGLLQLFDLSDFENRAPIATDQAVTTDQDVAKGLVLEATDPDGQTLTYTIISSPAHGALDGTPPNLTYTPVHGYSGADAFAFKASDGQAESNVASVYITVVHVNHPPTADPQTLALDQNASASFTLVGGDVDGDSLTFRITSIPAHGNLSGVAPNLAYTPAQDFYGSDSLSFVVNDGVLDSPSAVVAISVNHVNRPPNAIGQNVALDEDTTKTITLTGTDPDGDVLSFAIVEQPQHGMLTGLLPNLIYQPATDYFGDDSFTFRANDGVTDSTNLGFVSIKVRSINDPPTVVISTPLGGAEFDFGDPIPIGATAADKDGTIASLRLLSDGLVIHETQETTAAFDLLDASEGSHTLTAMAIDNDGASTTSAAVTINVRGQGNGPVQVNAGPDRLISLPAAAHLEASATVNGAPAGHDVQYAWEEVSGPGTASFVGSDTLTPSVTFSAPGDYILKLVATAPEGTDFDTVKVTVLAAPQAGPDSPISSQGREFWMAFLSQQPPNNEPDHAGAFLIISSEVAATGSVETYVTYGNSQNWQKYRDTQTFALEAGQKTLIEVPFLPAFYTDEYDDQALPTAVHIQADAPVAVHALNSDDHSTDGSLILPNSLLGREYRVMSYRNSPAPSGDPTDVVGGTQIAVVAIKDPTQITITPTASTPVHPAGQAFSITLHTGEVFRMSNNDDPESDFTGTLVVADKPVAVFGGHTCAYVPAETPYCDHLYEQMPPVDFWGRHFVTLPLKTRSGGDRYRALAAKDGTRISVNGQIVATLNAGQFYETILNQASSILGDQPILLAQFAQSSDFDHTTGDPFLTLIPPYEEFGRHYILGTQALPSYYTGSDVDFYDSYLGLIVASAETGSVTLNGQLVAPSEFTPIGDSGFSGASISVPKNTTLNVSAAVPIGAWLYGWASYESYGFTGGLYGEIDAATARFELTQSASSAPLGSIHHVIASFVSSAGLPVPDAEVVLSVTGANSINDTGLTAADGTVEFSWTGQQAGDDIITATTGTLSSSLSVSWVAGGDNRPPQVNAGPDVLVNLGQSLALHGTVQDDGLPAGGNLALQWSALPGPGDVTFSNPTSTDATATFIYPGYYRLRLTAYDGQFAGDDDLFVTVNIPPAFLFLDPSAETVDTGKYWGVGVSAEDQDGLIAKIELIEGNQVLDILQPNSQTVLYFNTILSTTFPTDGTHSLVVRLTDDRGATADRAIDITVRPAPTVQILTPTDNTSVAAGESVAFTASASSSGGTITRVVYSDVTDNYPFEIGDGAGPDYLFNWMPTYTGARLIAATAYDSAGAFGESAPITINLQSPGDPTLSITNPAEGSSNYLGQTVTIQTEASAVPPAAVSEVYFYDDTRYIGGDDSAPFEVSWTPETTGSHVLIAEAYDTFGGYVSTQIAVNVISVPPLDVSLLQPLAGSYLQVAQPTTLVANVENLFGLLDRIDFYVNGTFIGNGSPDSVAWTPTAAGDYALEAYAYSSSPSQNGYQIITVHVADLHSPVVQLSSPASGSSFPPGTPIFLQAQASDVDGNLSLLQFQENGNLLSETALSGGNGSATFTWANASPGWHGVDAVATDTTNQVGAASVRIFVQRPTNNELLPPSGLTASAISAGSIQLIWIAPSSQNSAATVVERRFGTTGAWEEIATIDPATVTYEDNTLESESYYSYRLAALDGYGARSAYSQESSATTMVQLPQYAVIDLGESLDHTLVSLDFIQRRFLYSKNSRGPLPLGGVLDLRDADVMSIAENNDILLKKTDTTSDGQTTIVYYFLYHPETQQSDYIGDPTFRAIRLSRDGVVAGAVDHSTISQSGVPDWIYTGLEFWLGVGSRPGTVRGDGSRIDIRAATWTPAGGVQEVMPAEANLYRYDRLDISPARMFPKPFDSLYSAWDVSSDGMVVGTGSWGDLRGISSATPLDSIASYEIYTRQHAMRWRGGQWDTSGSLRAQSFGEGESIVTAVNPLGTVVVGASAAPDRAGDPPLPTHGMRSEMSFGARLLEPGDPALQDLAPLGDGSYSWAWDVDAGGDAVGYSTKHQSDLITQLHAAYWTFGSSAALELPDLGGHNTQFPEGYGYANAINAAGDRIVGKSLREDGTTAGTVWALNANKKGDGQLWEGADLTPHIPSDWFVVEAVDLNKNGFIVGIAYHTIPDPDKPNGPPLQFRRSVLLVPVEFVSVTPTLKDESGNEIANSDKPRLLPDSNEMVKEPRPDQIPNVAYRNLKVKLPASTFGDTIKWSMTPLFIPPNETVPRFRGTWPQGHPDRFEGNNDAGGTYGFSRLSQGEGRTVVDENGETAIRINLPPIGFNKGAIKLEIEKYPGTTAEIDFEVPAIVVIDPGHGGVPADDAEEKQWRKDGSSWNNAACPSPQNGGSGRLEKDMTLDYGIRLHNALLKQAQRDKLAIRAYLTRDVDIHVSGTKRGTKARDNGADVFLIIHFNSNDDPPNAHMSRGTLEVRRTFGNVNSAEDTQLADTVIDRIVAVVPGGQKRDFVQLNTVVTNDAILGNTPDFHPIRSGYCEVEFIDNLAVDQLLNLGADAAVERDAIVDAMKDGIVNDLRAQPGQ